MTGPAEGDDAGGEKEYMYMFETDGRRFLFIRNIGYGAESVAQLVKDVKTDMNLVRKVAHQRRLRLGRSNVGETRRQLKKPNEIRIVDAIRKTFKAPEVGFPCYIVDCYGHEYIESKHQDLVGRSMYHSVSYWKLCNGGSLKRRWERPAIDTQCIPTSIFARMIRQVLSTFHWMYTAGPDPLYHRDAHAGNIWINWRRDTILPDFYVGDFGSARFAHDAPDTWDVAERSTHSPEPVYDLNQLYDNFYSILIAQGDHFGHGHPGRKALRKLCDGISKVVFLWKSTGDKETPPDLRPLIRWAQSLEEKYGKGGEEDETGSGRYMDFIAESRNIALKVERENALVVVTANIENALNPTVMDMSIRMKQQIHGPWMLVTVDGYWAEGGPVTHHRPNGSVHNPDGKEDLSVTKRRSVLNMALDVSSASDDPSPQPAFSFPGGDANRSTTAVDTESPPSTPEVAPEATWQPGEHDPEMFEKIGLGHLLRSDTAAPADINWQEVRSYVGKALKIAGGKIRSTLTPLENKAKHWHALLHGSKCECADAVWMADMENELKQARMARVVGEMHLAAFDFSEHDSY
ncbi:uncharacterized protein B0H64DRAFT_472030 [Chaetomium fimeti]|uniref:Protein kinase domain-containing protein n=1 Tax=Chaetomium fimeti TaxID=1854472 RepID=A0AAE0LVW5_9PEZI|nr:hypothetical protein B0H64DRAFT_472030 [Chaetomium fimeti]